MDTIVKLAPEIALFVATCVVMVLGLSRERSVRRMCAPVCAIGLVIAGYLAITISPSILDSTMPFMATYAKAVVAGVGLLLLMLMAGLVDRDLEEQADRGAAFEPIRSTRGEMYAFFLFSLMGVMLCAGSSDLIFLFLALELTSLPTYVMVSLSTSRNRSMEAGVKYFFLGALGAATFLYGFALIYGATGTTQLVEIARVFEQQARMPGSENSFNTLGLVGLVMAVVGVLFKIAAVPMHFYTPDVYQGAASPVSAFLAFVPKAAGFFAIMLLLGTVGWNYGPQGLGSGDSLPETLRVLLWTVAVLTMTVGNVLALLQTSVKRMLAYSSIAHSGYMLVGVIAGPGEEMGGLPANLGHNGLGAVLFYLLSYGVMTVGAFSVLAALERRTGDGSIDEVDHLNELRGLWKRHPSLAAVMVVCSLGLLGMPPLVGFLGKLPLFTSGLAAGETVLVVILGLNSAIAAAYYLRLVATPFLEKGDAVSPGVVQPSPFASRGMAGLFAALLVVGLGLLGSFFGEEAAKAGRAAYRSQADQFRQPRVGPGASSAVTPSATPTSISSDSPAVTEEAARASEPAAALPTAPERVSLGE